MQFNHLNLIQYCVSPEKLIVYLTAVLDFYSSSAYDTNIYVTT